jgi:hypothetical protein
MGKVVRKWQSEETGEERWNGIAIDRYQSGLGNVAAAVESGRSESGMTRDRHQRLAS